MMAAEGPIAPLLLGSSSFAYGRGGLVHHMIGDVGDSPHDYRSSHLHPPKWTIAHVACASAGLTAAHHEAASTIQRAWRSRKDTRPGEASTETISNPEVSNTQDGEIAVSMYLGSLIDSTPGILLATYHVTQNPTWSMVVTLCTTDPKALPSDHLRAADVGAHWHCLLTMCLRIAWRSSSLAHVNLHAGD